MVRSTGPWVVLNRAPDWMWTGTPGLHGHQASTRREVKELMKGHPYVIRHQLIPLEEITEQGVD